VARGSRDSRPCRASAGQRWRSDLGATPAGPEETRVAGLQLVARRGGEASAVGLQSDATPSICARERLIGRSRLRVNAEGIPYVLDSEDEDSDMEVKTDGVGVVPADGPGGQVLSVEGPPVVDADEASEIDLALEVAARLKKVLANIDPIYHGVFVSMCKVLVPIFFRP